MRYHFLILFVISLLLSVSAFSQDYSAVKSQGTIMENGEKYYVHTVVKGNTLYNISKAYNVATNTITKLNPELNEGLKLGLQLKIPYQTATQTDFIYHIVKKKETLYQISKIYNVTVDDIKSINNIKEEEISPGQYLKIPSMYVKANEDQLHQEATEVVTLVIDDKKNISYTVQSKETLFTISKRFGISIDALMYINDLNSSNISTGQVLLIPRKLIEIVENPSIDTTKFIQHKVKPKETLYGIARLYAIPIGEIKKYNELGEGQIQIGQTLNIPRELNETGYIKHRVEAKKEKLSKIASIYNVSLPELKEANPNIDSKLKRGESLLIPIGYVETDFEEQELLPQQEIVEEIEESDPISQSCPKLNTQTKKFKIAIMLPMYLEEVDSLNQMDNHSLVNSKFDKSFKFIEFYEGALLAAKELSQDGFDFDLHVYDVPRDVESTQKVLENPDLKDMDLILSLLYSKSFEQVNYFSKTYQIPLVNVLSKRRKILYDNPNVFKVEPNENALLNQVSRHILNHYKDHNIIIVRSNPYQLANEYQVLKDHIAAEIKAKASISNQDVISKVSRYEMKYRDTNIDYTIAATKEINRVFPGFDYQLIQNYPEDSIVIPNRLKTVIYSKDSLAGVAEASSLYRDNLVIALGNEEVFAIELFTKLNFVRDSFNYKVIGLPNWSQYNSLDVAYTQPMGLTIATNKFVDYNQENVQEFIVNFRSEYGIEPEVSRYAFLGYDVTRYFLSALYFYGSDFQNCLKFMDVELLENQLKFRKIPDAGFENTNWNLIQQRDYNYHLLD